MFAHFICGTLAPVKFMIDNILDVFGSHNACVGTLFDIYKYFLAACTSFF